MQKTLSFSSASALIKECYNQGIKEAVLSPGSRNTSLILALIHFPGIRCVSVIDERSAGFVALGMSKVSKRPTLLCCTSGTAGANYYPAVIEAYQSSIPLVVLTADRPAHLQQVGASQTIQQQHLFGRHVLDFIQLPEAETQNGKENPSDIQEDVIRALQLATSGGPVHINVPFNKPFEPTQEQFNQYVQDSRALVLEAKEASTISVSDLPSHRLVRPELVGLTTPSRLHSATAKQEPTFNTHHKYLNQVLDKEALLLHPDQVQNSYAEMKRPLIVIGSDPTPFQWFKLLPTLAKHPNARFILEPGASLYGWDLEDSKMIKSKVILGWEAWLYRLKHPGSSPFTSIDGIVRLGKEVVNPALARFLSESKHLTQLRFITHEPFEDALTSEPYFITPEAAFYWVDLKKKYTQVTAKDWHNALDEQHGQHLKRLAKQFSHTKNDILTDGAVFHRLSTIIPPSTPIFLSNSLPVRDQGLFAPMWSVDNPLLAQRGAAGIDGISSTALGVSLSTQLPMALITGDIAFLYDINALLSAKLITQPLIIFVINNGGGSIFSSLPVQQAAPESMEWFLTPQPVSIEHLAQGYGLSYTKIAHSKQLWESNWAEQMQNVLRTNILTSEGNHSQAKQLNIGKPDKPKLSHPTSTNSASNVRIVEFITNSQASIAERNQLRQ